MKRSHPFLFLVLVSSMAAQSKLAPDANGCIDSKILPKLPNCRVDNCETKDSDRREVPVGEEKGDAVRAAIEGDSRSVMYECSEGATPASIVQQAAEALKTAGFAIPYQYCDLEASLTARKDDLWVILESASRYYTLVELKSVPPDFESMTDADSIADGIERYGHVPLYAVHFLNGRPDMSPESVLCLEEVATMMNDHSDWRFRIEAHTDDTGTKMVNLTLSAKRASVVADWLVGRGIKRARLEAQGLGESRPVADNGTEAGRVKNRRIELVRLPAQ